MKILKYLFGAAAVGGAVVYARKHGGFKNAFKELVNKKDELLKKLSKTDDAPAKQEQGLDANEPAQSAKKEEPKAEPTREPAAAPKPAANGTLPSSAPYASIYPKNR